jgi:predicted CXXCH cytochrome family protein
MGHRLTRALCLMSIGAAAACTDTIFERLPDFDDPPDAAQGFLGYVDSDANQPVCGNCHVGMFAEWRGTAHADAWDDLQASGHAQESCEGCHTVGANGNPVTEVNVGWAATADPRYHDVQCESCHGPGLDHVTNPDATQPLAHLDVGAELTFGCGECHQGTHNPFVEEWSQSAHGKRGTFMQTREGCVNCHEGRGALETMGVDAEYIEKDQEEPLPIVCGVCHDPHDPTNSKQLRFPVDVADVDRNLCMRCHQRRAVPDPTSSHGPHSPQGPLLLGENVGWTPPNFVYDETKIVSTHGTERNQRLCATCHVNRMEITDAQDNFLLNASGHLFKPIPCLDEDGLPTASEECTLGERSFASCTPSGCHGDQNAARSAYISATDEIAGLVADLEALLDQVPADQFSTTDTIFTVAEGAHFNAELGAITSSAIHNPFLTEALLRASIDAVMEEYGVASPAGVAGSGR